MSTQAASSDSYEWDNVYYYGTRLYSCEPQTHSIHNGGRDIDWFEFYLSSTTNVVIETSGSSGDTRMYLYDDDVDQITWNDDREDDYFSKISTSLSRGWYYVMIDEYNRNDEINSYNILLQAPGPCGSSGDSWEPDDSYSQASTITSGSTQTHSIHKDGDDVDWVKFTLNSRSDVVIETSGQNLWGDDTKMWLYTSSGVPNDHLDYNDDGPNGYYSKISRTLDSGTYYVKIEEYGQNQNIASYAIDLTVTPSNHPPNEPSPISPVDDSSVYTATPSFSWSQFSDPDGDSQQKFQLRIRRDDGPNPDEIVLDRIYSSSANSITPLSSHYSKSLVNGGQYHWHVRVQDDNGAWSTWSADTPSTQWHFKVDLGDSYEPDDTYTQASTITSGSTQTHSIHDGGNDVDWVKFTLSENSYVVIETSGPGNDDTVLSLYNFNVQYITESDDDGTDSFSKITEQLDSGTYYVRVEEYNQDNVIETYYIDLSISHLPDLSISSSDITFEHVGGS